MTASTEERKPTSKAKPIREPLAALHGGPRHGWWYTEADWQLLRSSAERLPADVAQADVLAYSRTSETVAHPDGVNTGTVWLHRDAVRHRSSSRSRRGRR